MFLQTLLILLEGNLRCKLIANLEEALVSVTKDQIEDLMNLFSDFGLRGVSMDYLEKNSLFVFNSKHVKPPLQTRSCLVKRNKAIRKNGNAVVVFT